MISGSLFRSNKNIKVQSANIAIGKWKGKRSNSGVGGEGRGPKKIGKKKINSKKK